MGIETFILLTAAIALGIYIGNHAKARSNPALYPVFSKKNVDEAARKSDLFTGKYSKSYNKKTKLIDKIYKDIDHSVKKSSSAWLPKEREEEFKKVLREEIEFKLASEAYKSQYLFMLKANKDVPVDNKEAERIWKEFMKGEWFDLLDVEGGFSLWHRLKTVSDKRFEEEIKLFI